MKQICPFFFCQKFYITLFTDSLLQKDAGRSGYSKVSAPGATRDSFCRVLSLWLNGGFCSMEPTKGFILSGLVYYPFCLALCIILFCLVYDDCSRRCLLCQTVSRSPLVCHETIPASEYLESVIENFVFQSVSEPTYFRGLQLSLIHI